MLSSVAWTFASNTLAALGCGVLIGVERQFRHHVAGLKTNALVAVGSAIYVGLSLLMDRESSPTRIAAQIVSGLGFLGAGVIMREGFSVRGLNTAATIWCSGAVGSLAGAGFPTEAAIGTSAILLVNVFLLPVTRWIDAWQDASEDASGNFSILVECRPEDAAAVRALLLRYLEGTTTMVLTAVEETLVAPDRTAIEAHAATTDPNQRTIDQVAAELSRDPRVRKASWRRGLA